jgi:KUP system potassium uptake protein
LSKKSNILSSAIAALGVVYGDIGTSPLYTINEIFFSHASHEEISTAKVLGVISLVIWSLSLIVSMKYIIFVLKADYEGEGGVFALLGNMKKAIKTHKNKLRLGLITFLVFGAGLIFGDGLITPAISVLSAVEGLGVVTKSLNLFIVPITIGILFGLFSIQRKGTAKIGKFFGPIIILWFIAIAGFGLMQVFKNSDILQALNPYWAIKFIFSAKLKELLVVMGSVMLAVTGGEALFADMGHFGKKPIRVGWFSIVYPALICSYLGQGAYLLSGSAVVNSNVFFSMVPRILLVPMVILATCATVIASQALISGVFSLVSQGIAFGLMPRLQIKHTHEHHEGQIYIPAVNWALFAGCIALVLIFRSSGNLAAAYGLAVSIDMVMTGICMIIIANSLWHWSRAKSVAIFGSFLILEMGFLAANSLKLFQGGYIPLSVALVAFTIMSVWAWGRKNIDRSFTKFKQRSMQDVLKLKETQPSHLPTSLLVLSADDAHKNTDKAPALLNMFIERYGSLPKHVIALNIKQSRVHAHTDPDLRYKITEFENNHRKHSSLLSVTASFGFMDNPDLEDVITWISSDDNLTPDDDMRDWIVYVGRERLIMPSSGMIHHKFRASLFKILNRNSSPAYAYFGLNKDLRLTTETIPIKLKF